MSDFGSIYSELTSLRAEKEALEREIELRRTCGIAFFEPHFKQHLFFCNGDIKRRLVRTGNRWGKTTVGVLETLAWLYGERTWYKRPFPVRYKDADTDELKLHHIHDPLVDGYLVSHGLPQRRTKGLLIVTDWDKAEEIFTSESTGKIWQYIPYSAKPIFKKGSSGRISEIHLTSIHGGISTLYIETIDSWKRSKLSTESSHHDFIHVDEPLPEKMWISVARGLVDTFGSAWFCCTPLLELWINDRFIEGGGLRDAFPDGHTESRDIGKYKIKSWVITGSMHDNIKWTGEEKAAYIAELKPHEIETRIEGRPSQLTGVVYSEFVPDIHIYKTVPHGWSDYDKPPLNYTIRLAIDTHPKVPTAVLFAATSPQGRTYIYDEIFSEGLLLPGVCELILEKLFGRIPNRVLLEQAAWNPDPVDTYTYADVFAEYGLPIEPATKDLAFGIMEVKSMLLERDRGFPTLLFSPLLIETPREFDRYVWQEDKPRPVDKDDHMMEDLYRLVLSDLIYVSPLQAPHPYRNPIPINADLSLPQAKQKKTPAQMMRDRYQTAPRRENPSDLAKLDKSAEFMALMRGVKI